MSSPPADPTAGLSAGQRIAVRLIADAALVTIGVVSVIWAPPAVVVDLGSGALIGVGIRGFLGLSGGS